MMRSARMLVTVGSLVLLASSARAGGYDWNAEMRERQGQHEHDQAVKNREAARNLPLHLRGDAMKKYNQDRENALIKIAKARTAQGKSNWATRYRDLQYKNPK